MRHHNSILLSNVIDLFCSTCGPRVFLLDLVGRGEIQITQECAGGPASEQKRVTMRDDRDDRSAWSKCGAD